jgi:hypothetical protein
LIFWLGVLVLVLVVASGSGLLLVVLAMWLIAYVLFMMNINR